jgi:hypothetical protein
MPEPDIANAGVEPGGRSTAYAKAGVCVRVTGGALKDTEIGKPSRVNCIGRPSATLANVGYKEYRSCSVPEKVSPTVPS